MNGRPNIGSLVWIYDKHQGFTCPGVITEEKELQELPGHYYYIVKYLGVNPTYPNDTPELMVCYGKFIADELFHDKSDALDYAINKTQVSIETEYKKFCKLYLDKTGDSNFYFEGLLNDEKQLEKCIEGYKSNKE